jgi:hypothetical protein
MPPRSSEWIGRVKNVMQEFQVAAFAADLLDRRLVAEPTALKKLQLTHRDAVRFRANLEPTYLVRVYAEFEACLREAWRRSFGRRTFPKMEVLIDRIGALRNVPPALVEEVHQVRGYRNDIVHDVADGAARVSLGQARTLLCSYIGRLPLDW